MRFHGVSLALLLFGCLAVGGGESVSALPSPDGVRAAPLAVGKPRPASMRLAQAQPAPATATPAPAAPAPAAATDEPIGNVAALTGTATVIRNKNSIPLQLRDDIFLNDVVATSADSSLGVTFNDATTFHLSANAKITIDNYIYEDGGKQNNAIFDIGRGTVAFAAAAVAKTGDMKITTPTATLGIRGTTGLVEVPEGAAASSASNVNIKLYPDADGRVGRIEVADRSGAQLGALTQGASGFAIRPGAGGRVAAAPLAISPQQVARDQGFVRQVHATQTVGRQIVTEQRAFRRANPGLNNRGNQPAPPRQNGLPGQNRPGQPQPGAPNRQGEQKGQQQRPGGTQQPARPAQTPGAKPATPAQPSNTKPGEIRQGTQPAMPPQPAVQPRQGGLPSGAPGLQRPVPGNKPALQRPRPPAPPKAKPEKRKR